jgi:hypothetical protein
MLFNKWASFFRSTANKNFIDSCDFEKCAPIPSTQKEVFLQNTGIVLVVCTVVWVSESLDAIKLVMSWFVLNSSISLVKHFITELGIIRNYLRPSE